MRYLIAGGALLLAGVIAAFLVMSRMVDEARIEQRLVEVVMVATGQTLGVAGGIDVKLLPLPLVTLHRPTLGGDGNGVALTADRLDLEVELLPLLIGTLVVTDGNLVRPRLQLSGLPTTELAAWADQLAAGSGSLPWQRLSIVGGTLSTAARGVLVETIDAVLERDVATGSGSFEIEGRLAIGGGRGQIRLDGQLGRVPAGRRIPTQLAVLLTQDGIASRLAFRGLADLASATKGLDGQLSVDLPSPSALAAYWPEGDADITPTLLPAAPVTIEAALDLDLSGDVPAMRLADATLVVGGQGLTGSLALTLGEDATIELSLEADRLVLPEASPQASGLPLALARSLPSELAGAVELRAGVVEWHRQTFRQVALDLVLDGDGMLEIGRASAMLPGPGDVAFAGRIGPLGAAGAAQVTGRLEAAIQEPATLIAAFVAPPELLRRSTTLSIETDLAWEPSGVTLRDADLRLDGLRAEGGLAWRAGVDGRLPQLAVRALIDRLAFDDVLDLDTPQATVAHLLEHLAATDLALDLRVERTSLGEARFGGLILELNSSDGRVAVERASLGDIAGSAVSADGRIDAATGSFDLALSVDLASLPRLLRLFGETPQPALSLLGPLNLRGGLEGDGERIAFDATLEADQFAAAGSGRFSAWSTSPSGTARLTLDATAAADLVRQLGGVPVTDPLLQGPLQAEATIDLDQGGLAASALEVTLGNLALGLDAGRGTPAPGPLDRFAIRIGPLGPGTAELLYRLATPHLGLVPGPPAAWLGHWPAQELAWDWLWAEEVELALTLLLADPTLPPIEIIAHVRDGLLTIPALRIESEHGLIEAGIALAGRQDQAIADLAIDLAVEDMPAATLLEAVGVSREALAGRLALETRLLSSGRSLRALVANLEGQVDLVVDAVLLGAAETGNGGIPVGRLAATLAVERGVVRPLADVITFQGPDGTGMIDGYVDLLAWIVELDLALDGHAGDPLVRQRFFGPVGDAIAIAPEVSPTLPDGPAPPPAADVPAD